MDEAVMTFRRERDCFKLGGTGKGLWGDGKLQRVESMR